MQAEKDKVVSFHYQLSDPAGVELENSRARDPLEILLGYGQIIPGLETAIAGHVAGDRFEVVVAPEQGYGERRKEAVQRVPKKYFRDAEQLRPGMTAMLNTQSGRQQMVTVRKLGSSVIDVDLNHPMAGKTLHFAVEITAVRDATSDELEHGHAHGPGVHEH